jgi:hypothetical protein
MHTLSKLLEQSRSSEVATGHFKLVTSARLQLFNGRPFGFRETGAQRVALALSTFNEPM